MTEDNELINFYESVQIEGKLRTEEHARRWTAATLRILGVALDGRTKRRLARALPQELSQWLTDVFWLLHFRSQFEPGPVRQESSPACWQHRLPVCAVPHQGRSERRQADGRRDLQREVAEATAGSARVGSLELMAGRRNRTPLIRGGRRRGPLPAFWFRSILLLLGAVCASPPPLAAERAPCR